MLQSINEDLQKTDGPFVGGNDVNSADLKLGPQLKHVMVGAKSVKASSPPPILSCLHWLERKSQIYVIYCAQECGI